MESQVLELQQDLTELDKLLSRSTRDYVKQILVQERLSLTSRLKSISPNVEILDRSQQSAEKPVKQIQKFSWDQTKEKIKIYVTCFENFKTVPQENVVLDCTKNTVSVTVKDFNSADFVLKIGNLSGDVGDGRVSIKDNGFVVTLVKKVGGKWKSLDAKGTHAVSEQTIGGNEKDVSQELIKLMHDLYDEGDEEMKELISKGWSK